MITYVHTYVWMCMYVCIFILLYSNWIEFFYRYCLIVQNGRRFFHNGPTKCITFNVAWSVHCPRIVMHWLFPMKCVYSIRYFECQVFQIYT